MQAWLESKQTPGQFTGSTGAKVLSVEELSSGYQAWVHQVMKIIKRNNMYINPSSATGLFL